VCGVRQSFQAEASEAHLDGREAEDVLMDHIGFLAAPGIPEMLLAGREREFLGELAFPTMCATPEAISQGDVDEFVRTYCRNPRTVRTGQIAPRTTCCVVDPNSARPIPPLP
jgi:hypothetical protein